MTINRGFRSPSRRAQVPGSSRLRIAPGGGQATKGHQRGTPATPATAASRWHAPSSSSNSSLSISPGSKPVRLRSRSSSWISCSSSASSSSSQSAHVEGTIHHQPKCFHLGGRPFIAENHRDFFDPELARGLQAQVAIYHFAVTSNQAGDLKTKIHGWRGTCDPWPCPRIFNQAVDWPGLNLLRCLSPARLMIVSLRS